MSRKYAHSTLTLMAFFKCVVLQPVGRSSYKFVGRSAHALGCERQVLQRGKTLRSVGKIGSGYESSTLWARSTCLPPSPLRSVGHVQKPAKIIMVNATTWHFGPEDLVKTKLRIIFYKKSISKAFFNL
jgi:hypothetical protein